MPILRSYVEVAGRLHARSATIIRLFEDIHGGGYIVAETNPAYEPARTIYASFDWPTRPKEAAAA